LALAYTITADSARTVAGNIIISESNKDEPRRFVFVIISVLPLSPVFVAVTPVPNETRWSVISSDQSFTSDGAYQLTGIHLVPVSPAQF